MGVGLPHGRVLPGQTVNLICISRGIYGGATMVATTKLVHHERGQAVRLPKAIGQTA